MGYRTIVVGTDGSDTSMLAMEKAARLAKQVDGKLIVVCATAPVGLHDYRAKEILTDAAYALEAWSVQGETMFREGHPDKVLLDIAAERDADLIVIGNVGVGKAKRFRMGPLPERVASSAPCDVLIVYTTDLKSEEGQQLYHRILVGTDGSPTATEAIRKAFDLGMTFMLGVTLLYAAGDRIIGAIVLEQAAKAKHRTLKVDTQLVDGDPADAIRETAEKEGCDLIVVGNRGMTGVRRHLLGSVPTKVIHSAPTDVLIAKTVDRTVDDLVPGTGGLVDVDGRKLAVYKAEDGNIVALSPRCTHLGCTVDWNATAATWDCPCHGSRYSKEGEVVQGPAKAPLDREEL
jgi:nucleotide-binding universal stress UspA family protein/nitrite reductase/ring-hydroxylating ferredoxin subunit